MTLNCLLIIYHALKESLYCFHSYNYYRFDTSLMTSKERIGSAI